MRTLILVVILQLTVLLIETNGQYQFGDIIAFRRWKSLDPGKECLYKHYAVYVDGKHFMNKNQEQNIFEFSGTVREWLTSNFNSPISNCVFSTLDPKSYHSKDNYLDNFKDYKVGSEKEITERIIEKYRSCGSWKPKSNNCEHLATYVRYGVKVSVQHGAQFEGKAINDASIDTKEILEKIGKDDVLLCRLITTSGSRNG